jgi:hypothetical protein
MGMIWVGYRRSADVARDILEDEDSFEELLESDDDEASVDLDKAWHGIHWLLTGSAAPTDDVASDAIFGGEPVGEDLGYGPPRLLPAERVSELSERLTELGTDALRVRMDPGAMEDAGVYPSIWDEDDVFDTYLMPAFESLRTFYAAAALARESVIQTIC